MLRGHLLAAVRCSSVGQLESRVKSVDSFMITPQTVSVELRVCYKHESRSSWQKPSNFWSVRPYDLWIADWTLTQLWNRQSLFQRNFRCHPRPHQRDDCRKPAASTRPGPPARPSMLALYGSCIEKSESSLFQGLLHLQLPTDKNLEALQCTGLTPSGFG